jgi:MerR family redox-sensitive transcriptional activator SoxR
MHISAFRCQESNEERFQASSRMSYISLPRPERTHGHRRYSSRVFQQLAFIQLAQAGGFSMAEIQTLVSGFDESAPLGVRWRTLAEQKLAELDVLISRVQGMKHVLEEGMRCQCLDLDQCLPLEAGRCL